MMVLAFLKIIDKTLIHASLY